MLEAVGRYEKPQPKPPSLRDLIERSPSDNELRLGPSEMAGLFHALTDRMWRKRAAMKSDNTAGVVLIVIFTVLAITCLGGVTFIGAFIMSGMTS